jgi:rubrerythrin
MDKFLKMLGEAESIEQDGRKFYLESMEKTNNKFAKELFKNLAGEELVHYNTIKHIADMLSKGKKPSKDDLKLGDRKGLVFNSLIKDFKSDKPAGSEIEALKFAEKLEEKSIAHYANAGKSADAPVVKDFVSRLKTEEEGHLRSIRDSIEYIEDPQGWFSRKERGHYDGA